MFKKQKSSLQFKEQNYFNTEHLKTNLKQRSVRGGIVTLASQISKFTLKFGSIAVLARLLTPEDYGLIGMATVVIGFVEYFKDLGLSAATIQRQEINHQQVSTLFWINLGISCVVALAVVLMAPAIAAFYNEPRLQAITLGLAINFIFGGLTIQHQALLNRQMQFTSLAKIEVVSMLIGVIAAIVAAHYGLKYWALVLMSTVTAMTNALGVWIACKWRPGLPKRNSKVRSLLTYGRNLTGFRLINYFSRNLDNILIGRRWGSQQLALYAQAYRLLLLPIKQINAPIHSVALPTLSSLQAEPEKYCRYYYRAILLITTLGMPIVAFMFATANDLILLMLGEQWIEAVKLFQFLMPAAFIGTFNVAEGWVYQSLGLTARQLRIGIVMTTIDIIIFSVSVNWGATGVALAYGLSQPILVIFSLNYCYWGTHLKFKKFVKTISTPAIASIAAALILMAMKQFVFTLKFNLFLSISVDCLLYSVLYLLLWLILPGGKKNLPEIINTLQAIKNKSRPK